MKNMIAFVVCAIFATNIYAQPNQEHKADDRSDKIESLRIAFITERLQLTPQEAEKFFPVYNQYRTDLKALRGNFKANRETKLSAEQQLDYEQKKLDLKKKYNPQFESALGKEKTARLYNVEYEFRQKLKDIREQREHQRGKAPHKE